MADTFYVGISEYTVSGTIGETPAGYSFLVEHAKLHDDFGVTGADGTALVVTVGRSSEQWPDLVVSQRFEPGSEAGSQPGTLLIPENQLLLIGAGTRLLAYELGPAPRRLWEDVADVGFWGWQRHGDIVVMSAELELAAWNVHGKKLWSTFVEPPWEYQVRNAQLELDVMGKKSRFAVARGPIGGGVG